MYKINQILFSAFFIFLFCSCNGQLNTNDICKKKFKEARDLVYTYPDSTALRQSALDSALSLANECMQCDSIKTAVVDFKITLLILMKKYKQGINFIDSLTENDFTFAYKKKYTSKIIEALAYEDKQDIIKRNLVYMEVVEYLQQYIKTQNISNKEFNEIYTEMFTIKERYLDADQINKDVEDLKKLYPDKGSFFDFFTSKLLYRKM